MTPSTSTGACGTCPTHKGAEGNRENRSGSSWTGCSAGRPGRRGRRCGQLRPGRVLARPVAPASRAPECGTAPRVPAGPACRPPGTDAMTRSGPGLGPSPRDPAAVPTWAVPPLGRTADETPQASPEPWQTRPPRPRDETPERGPLAPRGLAPDPHSRDAADKAGPGTRPSGDPETGAGHLHGAEDHPRDRLNPRGSPTHWRRSATSRAAPGGKTRPGSATPKRSGSWPASAHRKRHGPASARPPPGQPGQP
jgi:hypothetical protein